MTKSSKRGITPNPDNKFMHIERLGIYRGCIAYDWFTPQWSLRIAQTIVQLGAVGIVGQSKSSASCENFQESAEMCAHHMPVIRDSKFAGN